MKTAIALGTALLMTTVLGVAQDKASTQNDPQFGGIKITHLEKMEIENRSLKITNLYEQAMRNFLDSSAEFRAERRKFVDKVLSDNPDFVWIEEQARFVKKDQIPSGYQRLPSQPQNPPPGAQPSVKPQPSPEKKK